VSKERVGSFYDVVWTEYLPEYEASEKHWLLFFTPEEIRGASILDAGCGTGIFSVIFARNGAGRVTGIDISPGSLGTAERLGRKFGLENVRFERRDMLALPYPDASFDVVWAWGTVHHTTNPLGAVAELMRTLKPGGSILLAIYKKTRVTWIHEAIRKTLIRTPRGSWNGLAKIMAFFGAPVVRVFKKREKSRKGEKLSELILDWYFVPIRHHYTPEEIRFFLEARGYAVEKYLAHSGRFDSSSNFIYKARKPAGG
jgi:ubiquinone/menaquinone biosynthesis C-methylase UbiE